VTISSKFFLHFRNPQLYTKDVDSFALKCPGDTPTKGDLVIGSGKSPPLPESWLNNRGRRLHVPNP